MAPVTVARSPPSLRTRVLQVIEAEGQTGVLSKAVNGFLTALILLNVVAVALETVVSLEVRYGTVFQAFLAFSVAVFTLEYLLRLWACTDHPSGRYARPVVGRLRYIFSPLAIMDLLAVLPFYLSAFLPLDLRFLRVIRALWILKIMRYLTAVETLGIVVRREKNTLFAMLTLLFVILFLASSFVYLAEREVQPESFASIPDALWWGIATLTTVGYGDIVPRSSLGKLLGAVIMLLGIGTFALPAGILAAAFTEVAKRKSFMVTWNLVAHVPLFAHLRAGEIARIADLLHPRTVTPNEIIFHRDEDAQSMYFVVSGVVEVEILPEPVRLRKGDYFGEVALLYHRKRTATIMSVTYVELLELDAGDLNALLDANPDLKARVTAEAERRLSRTEAVY